MVKLIYKIYDMQLDTEILFKPISYRYITYTNIPILYESANLSVQIPETVYLT